MNITVQKRLPKKLLDNEIVTNSFSYSGETGESADGMRRSFSYSGYATEYGTISNETRNADGSYSYEYHGRRNGYSRDNERDSFEQYCKEILLSHKIDSFTASDENHDPAEISMRNLSVHIRNYRVEGPEFSLEEQTLQPAKEALSSLKESYWDKNRMLYYALYSGENNQSNRMFNYEYNTHFGNNNPKFSFSFSLEGLTAKEAGEAAGKVNDLYKEIMHEHDGVTVSDLLQNGSVTQKDLENYFLEDRPYSTDGIRSIPKDVFCTIAKGNPEFVNHVKTTELSADVLKESGIELSPENVSLLQYKEVFGTDLGKLDSVIQHLNNEHSGFTKAETDAAFDYFSQFLSPEHTESLYQITDLLFSESMNFSSLDPCRGGKDFAAAAVQALPQEKAAEIMLKNPQKAKDFLYETGVSFLEGKEGEALAIEMLKTNSSPGYDGRLLSFLSSINTDRETVKEAVTAEDSRRRSFFDRHHDFSEIKDFLSENIPSKYLYDAITVNKDLSYTSLTMSSEDRTLLNERLLKNIGETLRYQNVEAFAESLSPQERQNLSSSITPNELLKLCENRKRGYVIDIVSLSDGLSSASKVVDISADKAADLYRMLSLRKDCHVEKDTVIKNISGLIKNEAERDAFVHNLQKEIVCPETDRNWNRSKGEYISIPVPKKFTREKLKSILQKDPKLFSTKVLTTEHGRDKSGKSIAIDNVSKWLFGVPGNYGHLEAKDGYLKIPENTPKEIIDIVQEPIAKDLISYMDTLCKMLRAELSNPQMYKEENIGRLRKEMQLVTNELYETKQIGKRLIDTGTHPEYQEAFKQSEYDLSSADIRSAYSVFPHILEKELQKEAEKEKAAAVAYASDKNPEHLNDLIEISKKVSSIYQDADRMFEAIDTGEIHAPANIRVIFKEICEEAGEFAQDITADLQMDVHNPENERLIYNLARGGNFHPNAHAEAHDKYEGSDQTDDDEVGVL